MTSRQAFSHTGPALVQVNFPSRPTFRAMSLKAPLCPHLLPTTAWQTSWTRVGKQPQADAASFLDRTGEIKICGILSSAADLSQHSPMVFFFAAVPRLLGQPVETRRAGTS